MPLSLSSSLLFSFSLSVPLSDFFVFYVFIYNNILTGSEALSQCDFQRDPVSKICYK